MIQAVIFDIDGTLIDSVDAHADAWVQGFAHHGVHVSLEDMRRQIGKGGDQLLPTVLDPLQIDKIGKDIEAEQSRIFKASHQDKVRPFPGARALFERLRDDGVKRVLGSSGKPADADRNQDIAGIADLVDAVATSEDADRSKPSPDIVHAALEKIEPIPPSQCVFVGDTPFDAEAAARAGVATVGVASGAFSADELRKAGCVFVVTRLTDLLDQYDALVSVA